MGLSYECIFALVKILNGEDKRANCSSIFYLIHVGLYTVGMEDLPVLFTAVSIFRETSLNLLLFMRMNPKKAETSLWRS